MNRSKEFYLIMLSKLLLEIRNLEDSDIEKAKALGYIFHNVPDMLRQDYYTEENAEKAFEHIKSRAEQFGLLDWVEQREKIAFEWLEWEESNKKPPI